MWYCSVHQYICRECSYVVYDVDDFANSFCNSVSFRITHLNWAIKENDDESLLADFFTFRQQTLLCLYQVT